MQTVTVLAVGERAHLGFAKGIILYAGMPSETSFSIVQRELEFPYKGYAWNLYFPKDTRELTLRGKRFAVDSVSAESITLRLL